jgi:tetratricopeptide (TPR) repeat protein
MEQPELVNLFRQAAALHRQGRMTEAEALYARIVEVQPDHFDALHNLGILKAQQRNNPEAERFISAALRLRPQSPEALSSLGNVLSAAKRHEEAIAAFNRALALNPRNVGALLNRGNALSGAKRYEEGLASYDQALSASWAGIMRHWKVSSGRSHWRRVTWSRITAAAWCSSTSAGSKKRSRAVEKRPS